VSQRNVECLTKATNFRQDFRQDFFLPPDVAVLVFENPQISAGLGGLRKLFDGG
jgi:hypothetical protein